jgi:glycosyltransferase involved in cell wall biosynthesis
MKMKRILFIRRAYSFGGAERRLLDWLGRIDYSFQEVFVISPVDVFSERMKRVGLLANYIQLEPHSITRLFGRANPLLGKDDLAAGEFWPVFSSWLRFLSRVRPQQIVFMEGYFFSFPLACVLAGYIATKGHVYMTDHTALLEGPPLKTVRLHWGMVPGLGLWWYRKVWPSVWPWRMRARLCRKILAASETVKNREVTFYGYPPEKMGIINHGVDVVRFVPSETRRAEWREAHSIPAGDLVMVSTGRLQAQKRIDRLLGAFVALARGRRNIWLLLAGDGPLRQEVEAAIRALDDRQVARRIRLLGHQEDVLPVLQAADIFVLTSDNEGFGIALVEAMATGLVCVSTATAGPDTILNDGENGFLVDVSDAGILVGLGKAIGMSADERVLMGARARQTAMERYELQSAITRALRLLDVGFVDAQQVAAARYAEAQMASGAASGKRSRQHEASRNVEDGCHRGTASRV